MNRIEELFSKLLNIKVNNPPSPVKLQVSQSEQLPLPPPLQPPPPNNPTEQIDNYDVNAEELQSPQNKSNTKIVIPPSDDKAANTAAIPASVSTSTQLEEEEKKKEKEPEKQTADTIKELQNNGSAISAAVLKPLQHKQVLISDNINTPPNNNTENTNAKLALIPTSEKESENPNSIAAAAAAVASNILQTNQKNNSTVELGTDLGNIPATINTTKEPQNNIAIPAEIAASTEQSVPPISSTIAKEDTIIPEHQVQPANVDNSAAISAAIAAAVSQLLKSNQNLSPINEQKSIEPPKQEPINELNYTAAASAAISATQISAPPNDLSPRDTKNSNENKPPPEQDSEANHDDVYLDIKDTNNSDPVSAPIYTNVIPGPESASIPAAIAASTQQSDTSNVAETEQNIPVLPNPPVLEVQPTNVDNSAAITAAIAAAVSQLLKTNPELISPTQTNDKESGSLNQHLIVSDKTQHPNVNASAQIASAISAAIQPQPTLLDEPISNNINNAEAVATNQETSTSQQKGQTTTIPTNNARLKSESDISAATAAAVAASVATTPVVDTTSASTAAIATAPAVDTTSARTAAAIAASQPPAILSQTPAIISQTPVQTHHNLISSESNLNITPAVAAAIGAHLNQPAAPSQTTQQPIILSQNATRTQQNITPAVAAAIAAETSRIQQPKQPILSTTNNNAIASAISDAISTNNIISNNTNVKSETNNKNQNTENLSEILQKVNDMLDEIYNISKNAEMSDDVKTQSYDPLIQLISNIQFPSNLPDNLNLQKTLDEITKINAKINEIIKTNPQVKLDIITNKIAKLEKQIKLKITQQNTTNFNTNLNGPSQPPTNQQQPPTIMVPEDTQVLYNNLLYKVDPTDPSQIIETSHKKNTDTNEIEKRTRILRLANGTTVQMKDESNQWVPLNINEYDTDEANITINGITAALKTFAKEAQKIKNPLTTGGAPSYRDREDDDDNDYDDTASPQIIKDGQITTIIYKNIVYTLDPNEKWIKENYFQLNEDGDSITRMRKLRLDDKNIMMQIKDIII